MPMKTSNSLLTISQAAKKLNVSTKTLRRWEKAGKITSFRTPGGHRRYDTDSIKSAKNSKRTNFSIGIYDSGMGGGKTKIEHP